MRLRRLLVFLTVILTAFANAGSYVASYVGGQSDSTTNGTTTTTDYQTYKNNYGYYYRLGETGGLSFHMHGKITATLTWTGDGPRPKVVILSESAFAYAYGHPGLIQGSATTGMADETVSTYAPPHDLTEDYEATFLRYTVITDPGPTITVDCSPEVLGTLPPGGDNSSGIVDYSAQAEPVTLTLGGGIQTNSDNGYPGDRAYLIGQRVTAGVAVPFQIVQDGGVLTNQWSISAGEPFKQYRVEVQQDLANHKYLSTGQLVPLADADLQASGLLFSFGRGATDPTTSTVACQVHIDLPDDALPASGLDLNLSADVSVLAPAIEKIVINNAIVHLASPETHNGANVSVVSVTNPPYTYPGFYYSSQATTPDAFVLKDGSGKHTDPGGWAWVQLMNAHISRTRTDGTVEYGYYGPDVNGRYSYSGLNLDNDFPYPMPSSDDPNHLLPVAPTYLSPKAGVDPAPEQGIELFRADGQDSAGNPSTVAGYAEDHPSALLEGDTTSYNVGATFNVWQMYRPPGEDSQFVPLQTFGWGYSANPVWDGAMWGASVLKQTSGPVFSLDKVKFPQWSFLDFDDFNYYHYYHQAPTTP